MTESPKAEYQKSQKAEDQRIDQFVEIVAQLLARRWLLAQDQDDINSENSPGIDEP